MKGDKKIILPIHYKKANKILKILQNEINKNTDKYVIAIAGQSGVGKTEIASLLQEKLYGLNFTTKIIYTDDYYKTNWHVRNEIRMNKGLQSVGQKEISWLKLNRVIRDFKNNKKELKVQQIHKYTDSTEKQTVNTSKLKIIIIEGLYALYTKNVDYNVYLEGGIKDTYKFRKQRGKENPDNPFRKKVLQKEAGEVLKSKPNANLIIKF